MWASLIIGVSRIEGIIGHGIDLGVRDASREVRADWVLEGFHSRVRIRATTAWVGQRSQGSFTANTIMEMEVDCECK
jgi:hypothetical protein